jgi:probable F420-dependent oxidoreductase
VELGRIGIWERRQDDLGAVAEIEALGFGTFWIGRSPSLTEAREYLEATSTMTIATGILNVWQHAPADVAAGNAELRRDFGERWLLGIGIGHPERTSEYQKPLSKMREYLDGLDAADPPVPPDELVVAALGPKMLELAAERSLGAHPYFTPVEHTRFARERIGADKLLAPEVTVVVDPDPESAREKARGFAASYLALTNYAGNLLRLGYTEADLADGGSDRLIDAVVPHGSAEQVAEAVHEHLDAGADHVCLQPVGHGDEPLDDYRALARALL